MIFTDNTKTEGEGAGMAADLRYFISSAEYIAKVAKDDKITLEKSTLPVRTAEKVKEILDQNNNDINFFFFLIQSFWLKVPQFKICLSQTGFLLEVIVRPGKMISRHW